MTDSPGHALDPVLEDLVRAAGRRLTATLARETPALGATALPWLTGLSRGGDLGDYFLHPRRFPVVQLPWWAAEGTSSRQDLAFHEDLVLGTMSGYCHVRLLDDVMDRGGGGLDLLPAAAVFHLEFQSAWQRWFPADSPFWTVFRACWLRAADATVPPPDPTASALDDRAEAVLGPALIPVAGALLHAGLFDRYEAWRAAVGTLARTEQFLDDLLDWQTDADRGQPNLLLAEASRRRPAGEPVLAWVVREGYAWGLDEARARLAAATTAVAPLGHEDLHRFVTLRAAQVEALAEATGPGLRQLADLARAFEPPAA